MEATDMAPAIAHAVADPYIRALTEKEAELIVLRSALNEANRTVASLTQQLEESKRPSV